MEIPQKIHDRSHDRAPHPRLDRAVAQFAAFFPEHRERRALAVIGKDGGIGRDSFLHGAVERAKELLLTDEIAAHEFSQPCRYEERERQRHDRRQRENGGKAQHHDHGARDRENGREQRRDRLRDRARNVFRIIGHAREQIAVAVRVGVGDGEPGHFFKQVAAQ